MLGFDPSVSSLRIRLTEKSEVEFGGVAEVLASDDATMERARADITATDRTATLQVIRRNRITNLPFSVFNGTATAESCAQHR